tara:strand:+ start:832 stop:2022 length:1191 start_codon:yes stop_codon:yes gene_type:complete
MFENIQAAPADPILGLTDAFNTDSREQKVNLGVGVYKDDAGKTPVLSTVKKAEALVLETETTKSYLAISGSPAYGACVQPLLFGQDSSIIADKRAQTAQAPGGTGALRIAADFYAKQCANKTVWISDPTWANHVAIFKAAGLEIKTYTYYDPETRGLNFEQMIADLAEAKPGDMVLLHGCCHNPTGIDPTREQWQTLADLSTKNGWLPLFDFAYQGFASGIEEDAAGLRLFAKQHEELLIASSFSKNFGLYNERVGAFTLVAKNAEQAACAFSQVKIVIRSNYSNPPAHGGKVVQTILDDEALRSEWESELTEMRQRIRTMRTALVDGLKARGVDQDFSFISEQNGMFSFSGLTKEQVEKLKENDAIYIVGSGRINVAGITSGNIDYLCDAIARVL